MGFLKLDGRAYRDRPRTLDALLKNLIAWFTANPTASFEIVSTLSENHSGGGSESKRGQFAA